jgi:hypothetical protein
MATQSRVIWDSGDPQHPATVTMFWDDVALLLTRVEIDNTTGQFPLKAQAVVLANGRSFQTTVQPGNTFAQNIPTGAATRMELFINATNGRLDGIEWHLGM